MYENYTPSWLIRPDTTKRLVFEAWAKGGEQAALEATRTSPFGTVKDKTVREWCCYWRWEQEHRRRTA